MTENFIFWVKKSTLFDQLFEFHELKYRFIYSQNDDKNSENSIKKYIQNQILSFKNNQILSSKSFIFSNSKSRRYTPKNIKIMRKTWFFVKGYPFDSFQNESKKFHNYKVNWIKSTRTQNVNFSKSVLELNETFFLNYDEKSLKKWFSKLFFVTFNRKNWKKFSKKIPKNSKFYFQIYQFFNLQWNIKEKIEVSEFSFQFSLEFPS